jgi:hypothetical protein
VEIPLLTTGRASGASGSSTGSVATIACGTRPHARAGTAAAAAMNPSAVTSSRGPPAWATRARRRGKSAPVPSGSVSPALRRINAGPASIVLRTKGASADRAASRAVSLPRRERAWRLPRASVSRPPIASRERAAFRSPDRSRARPVSRGPRPATRTPTAPAARSARMCPAPAIPATSSAPRPPHRPSARATSGATCDTPATSATSHVAESRATPAAMDSASPVAATTRPARVSRRRDSRRHAVRCGFRFPRSSSCRCSEGRGGALPRRSSVSRHGDAPTITSEYRVVPPVACSSM